MDDFPTYPRHDPTVFYPDMVLVIGETQVNAEEGILNPAVLLEVLSLSTAAFDRGEKFEKYQKLASLRHYIRVEQERLAVTHFEKIAGNLWAIVGVYNDLQDTITVKIEDVSLTVGVAQLYRHTSFTREPTATEEATQATE